MRLVVDASALVLAAHASDPRATRARRVLPEAAERVGLSAPALLQWELGQVFHRKLRDAFPEEALRARAVELLLAGLDLDEPDAGARARTGALAAAHGLSYYDASYLELTARDDASWLVTEDAALLKAARAALGKDRGHTLASLDAHLG